MLLEAAHTSDPSFDPAMVLLKSIIRIDVGPVADVAAQRGTNRAWIGVMPVRGHPVGHKSDNRARRVKEPLGRSHITGFAQHRIDEVPGTVDRPIQVVPTALDLQVGFIDIPTLAKCVLCRDAACATPRPSRAAASPFPLADAFMTDSETTQQHDLTEIPQCQPVAQPAEHHERDDVARQ
jgi:hypothetical protein